MKNIMIIGGRGVGKTSLVMAMADALKKEHPQAVHALSNSKPFVITNPYKDDIIYDGSYHKTKEKKAYWSKGKKKCK